MEQILFIADSQYKEYRVQYYEHANAHFQKYIILNTIFIVLFCIFWYLINMILWLFFYFFF